ncbi:MAG: SAM-dependent methyltransferase, partial [Prevotellaceae bacterium]|nr:SAM-dependent methyltransferase [Prevotellaceae bacterium]
MAYNKKEHLQTNIEAIRIAFALDKEKRRATEAERSVLQQYSGFGGIKCILNPVQTEADKASWKKSDVDLFPMVVDLHKLIHENSRDENEYRRYFNSLKSSILTAFYTPPEIVKVLSDALKNSEITPVRFLEPSAGNGAFADVFRETFPNNKTVCFEKDLLTGKILSHLHPDDKVHIRGFEEIENRPDNRFDVIASNIPFGDTAVFDVSFLKSGDAVKRQATRAVHNYFFLKGVETLREGGLLAFITSQGVMNSPSNKPVREWLMKNTNLISVIRLPNNLMSDNAGTEVGSDLIILQKDNSKLLPDPEERAFFKSRTLSNGININNYFQDFSRIVHTKGYLDKDLYGNPGMIFIHEDGITGMAKDLKNMLFDDFSERLDKKLYQNNSISIQPKIQITESKEKIISQQVIPKEGAKLKEVTPTVEQQPLLTLYDLFELNEEERSQINKPKQRRKKTVATQGKPGQLNLFAQPVNNSANTAKSGNNPINSATPVVDARKEELEKQLLELSKPRPYSGILEIFHKQGSLVMENNGQIGYLKERYSDDAVFKSLELNPIQEDKAKQYIKLRDTYNYMYNY